MNCNSYGPWFVALLFNTSSVPPGPPKGERGGQKSSKHKEHTELVAHTYPHLMVDVLNAKHAQSVWVILMKAGPFERWAECVAFLQAWSAKTRGRVARIEKGIRMWSESHQQVTLWLQTQDRDAMVQDYRTKKRARKESDGHFLEDMRVYTLRGNVHSSPLGDE